MSLSFAFPVARRDNLDWRVTACFGLSQALSSGTWSFSLQKSLNSHCSPVPSGLASVGDGAGRSHLLFIALGALSPPNTSGPHVQLSTALPSRSYIQRRTEPGGPLGLQVSAVRLYPLSQTAAVFMSRVEPVIAGPVGLERRRIGLRPLGLAERPGI